MPPGARDTVLVVVQNPDGFKKQYMNGTNMGRVQFVDIPEAIQMANNRKRFPPGVGTVLISEIFGYSYRNNFCAQASANGVDWDDIYPKLPDGQVAKNLLQLLKASAGAHSSPVAARRV